MVSHSDSTVASGAHHLAGATPSGAGEPRFEPVTGPAQLRPRPHPRRKPALGMELHPLGLRDCTPEREVIALGKRLVEQVNLENRVRRKLKRVRRYSLLEQKHRILLNVMTRVDNRVDRILCALAKTRAPTLRATAVKGAALIETACAVTKREVEVARLGTSLAHDVGHLHLEATCLPQIPGGNFGAYHEAVLKAHADMEALPPGATDADANVFMDRWGEIDRMAMADRPRTFADAIGALLYARREFYQFHVEVNDDTGSEVCNGDRLVLHLIDGALQVLGRVVQEDVASTDLALMESTPATLAGVADLDFEPWPEGEGMPHTDDEWAGLANPYLVTSRMAWRLHVKDKAAIMEMVHSLDGEEGEVSIESMAQRLTEAVDFFEGYRALNDSAWIRLASAAAMVAREEGEPEAQRSAPATSEERAPDRRAVAAYREWLHMEARLLSAEMYPQGGDDADRFIPANTAANHYHFPLGNGASWRDLPQPASRAEAMCRVLGIDWTKDEPRDECYLHYAPPAVAKTEAA